MGVTEDEWIAVLIAGASFFALRTAGFSWTLCILISGYFLFGFAIGYGYRNRKG